MDSLVEDLSAYLIGGRVRSHLTERPHNESSARTPAMGLEDGVLAEQLGFRRVFLSERWDLKEAAAFLSAVGARTSRLELGTGVLTASTRHPSHTAAFAATMQALHGPRFVLGLGRGEMQFMRQMGLGKDVESGYDALTDLVALLRRLWTGERIDYDGPAGSFRNLCLRDVYAGPPPPIWFGTFGLPKSAAAIAEAFDGALLMPMLTPEATARAVSRIRLECERIGRDPASVRIAQCVVTAPGLDERETRELTHARAITYLDIPRFGDPYLIANQWDRAPVDKLRAYLSDALGGGFADLQKHRRDLSDATSYIPDAWMRDCNATGSVADCVAKLGEFRAAGADEIVTYGSTPGQNADLLAAWRARGKG